MQTAFPVKKVVLGVVIAHCPEHSAGNTWAFLQWALGFRRAGWEVWLVEHLESHGLLRREGEAQSVNESMWRQVCTEFGFEKTATLFVDDAAQNAGAFTEFACDAPLFVNLSGQFKLHHRVEQIPRRVYVDIDPGFTQLWAAVAQVDMNFAGHTHFFSVASSMDTALLPDTGHRWLPTLPPVCCEVWSPEAVAADPTPLPAAIHPQDAWTTITHWYGYKQMPWDGRIYGTKQDSLVKIRDLPKAGQPLAVATDLQPDWEDYAEFSAAGWKFLPNTEVCDDWRQYRKFLAFSAGEIGVAKDGYVVSKCGWFSDRSACYLALGRPVALQDTGWQSGVPEGDGLLAWRDLESAARVLNIFAAEPVRHQAAARALALEHFDAPKVVNTFLSRLSREP